MAYTIRRYSEYEVSLHNPRCSRCLVQATYLRLLVTYPIPGVMIPRVRDPLCTKHAKEYLPKTEDSTTPVGSAPRHLTNS